MAEVQRALHVMPIWRVVAGGLIVVGICSLLCWRLGWCWWCHRCPDVDCCEPEGAAQIILEDMHAAVWMPIENTSFHFSDPDSADEDASEPMSVCEESSKAFGPCEGNYELGDDAYRHGVLFQTGPTMSQKDGLTTRFRYGGVYIEHAGGTDWLLPEEADDFDWLDVIATGTKCVIDPWNAYMLVHTPTDEKDVPGHITGGHADDVLPNTCDSTATSGSGLYCLRDRSIHASVMPTRIVTYWPAGQDDFYTMAAKATVEIPIVTPGGSVGPTHGDPTHVSYHFALPDRVVVDRWRRGCHQQRYTGVTLLRILHHDPPLNHLGYPHRIVDGE